MPRGQIRVSPPTLQNKASLLRSFFNFKTEKFDIIIVGGVPGFFAAINTAQMNPDLSIVILEECCSIEVKISGGGRCNVTHAEFIPNELVTYYPEAKES